MKVKTHLSIMTMLRFPFDVLVTPIIKNDPINQVRIMAKESLVSS